MACITLLSDLGLQDASVAIAKGMLMQHAPGYSIIDISHEVAPFNLIQAAYLLEHAYRQFPPSTCHIILFDIYNGKFPALVLSEFNGHFFFTPDNGIVPLTFPDHNRQGYLCLELIPPLSLTDWIVTAGKMANDLQSNTVNNLGLAPHMLRSIKRTTATTVGANEIKCDVLHIDHFGNVVLNIRKSEFDEAVNGRRFRIVLMQIEDVTEISIHYNDVREGNKLCRFNSSGYLEVCVNRGRASTLFGFRPNSIHNDIKIIIE